MAFQPLIPGLYTNIKNMPLLHNTAASEENNLKAPGYLTEIC
jgi:hypothetical protein